MKKTRFNLGQRFLEVYSESWKKDHKEAMECRDIEELVRAGIAVFGFVDDAPAEEVKRFCRDWMEVAAGVRDAMIDCGNKGYEIEGTEEFHTCFDRALVITEKDEWDRIAATTPSRDELAKRAKESPPPQEWFEQKFPQPL